MKKGKLCLVPAGSKKKPRFTIVVSGDINEELYNYVLTRVGEYLNEKQCYSGITVLITSGGGVAYIAMAIYDILKTLNADIWTVAVGECASAATIIFALGNRRFVSENLNFLVHTSRIELESLVTMREVKYLTESLESVNEKIMKILGNLIDNENFEKRLQDDFASVKEDFISIEDLLNYGVATDKLEDFASVLY